MEVRVDGELGAGVTPKDVILAIIGKIGTSGGIGHAIEYTGSVFREMSMEGRMTVCNMSIEAGARTGMVAPDEKTFNYLRGREYAPGDADWDAAVERWKALCTDDGATFDTVVELNAADISPQVTWGTNPAQVLPVGARVPKPGGVRVVAGAGRRGKGARVHGAETAASASRTSPSTRCSSARAPTSRIEDLRAAADVAKGRQKASSVRALVVPGSWAVKQQAEAEGLDRVFTDAGFEWRDAGCSMCLAMNPDRLAPGERSASTSNRNFEGRQGPGGRTHLVSPSMAAAAAITGHFVDVRDLN